MSCFGYLLFVREVSRGCSTRTICEMYLSTNTNYCKVIIFVCSYFITTVESSIKPVKQYGKPEVKEVLLQSSENFSTSRCNCTHSITLKEEESMYIMSKFQ